MMYDVKLLPTNEDLVEGITILGKCGETAIYDPHDEWHSKPGYFKAARLYVLSNVWNTPVVLGLISHEAVWINNGEPVVLAGWHREVYEIWLKELKDYNPVMYTGSESAKQKDDAVKEFIEGRSNLFIISLRSGVGLDGLQYRCKCVVYGELDYSPKVHSQVTGRVDRDGQTESVTEIYLASEWGSDPVIIDILGVKSSQSHGILNPNSELLQQNTDDSWMRKLAQSFLNKTEQTHDHSTI